MVRSLSVGLMLASLWGASVWGGPANADERQEACKQAMNDRIQACTDECTKAALAAASNYQDTNNNVKFGCMKGCAMRQIFQMKACREGRDVEPDDPTETNR